TPPGFEEIQRQETARLFGRLAQGRLFLIPLFLGLHAWIVVVDRTPWRVGLLSLALPIVAVFIVAEHRRYRAHGLRPGAIDLNVWFATLGVMLLTTASGGIDSPLLPVVLIVAVATALKRTSPWVHAVLVAWIWLLALEASFDLLPWMAFPAIGAPRGVPHGRAFPTATVVTVLLLVIRVASRALRASFDTMLARTVTAQQESLRAHAERAEELTALSGEIAHELKNPLASVKGLAALLTQHCPDGKGAERLGVLRREVDRMQATLDEFLNFSRPVVPLALADADVAALGRDVVLLHEGMAHERGLSLAAPTGRVLVRCDARKVRQILINLLQNAIDASPRGGEVAIQVEAGGGATRLRVLDRGRGIDASLGDQAFRPGVTTKDRGSGLGLTIARALARQHGGEVTLAPREGGGTVAEVALPADREGA
ncbi:MAG TPA: HAMP domain-containing sensor histidine kinase, partial [Anaeromyxobacteraceae bacterium]|nr:HAMP domain-containing sensor histidine kinase [Anaeromyxobacteraceae bacterium]